MSEIIRLDTENTSYIMFGNSKGVLKHLYYGRRLHEKTDLAFLVKQPEIQTLEFVPGFELEKYIKTAGNNQVSVDVHLKNKKEKLKAVITYTVYAESDVIKKQVCIVNKNKTDVRIEGIPTVRFTVQDKELNYYADFISENPSGMKTEEENGRLIYTQEELSRAVIKRGESVSFDEALLCYSSFGKYAVCNKIKKFTRMHLAPGFWSCKEKPVVYFGSLDEKEVLKAASSGAEVYCLDDFRKYSVPGDWEAGTEVREFAHKVHDMKMQFGLGLEIDEISRQSKTFRECRTLKPNSPKVADSVAEAVWYLHTQLGAEYINVKLVTKYPVFEVLKSIREKCPELLLQVQEEDNLLLRRYADIVGTENFVAPVLENAGVYKKFRTVIQFGNDYGKGLAADPEGKIIVFTKEGGSRFVKFNMADVNSYYKVTTSKRAETVPGDVLAFAGMFLEEDENYCILQEEL